MMKSDKKDSIMKYLRIAMILIIIMLIGAYIFIPGFHSKFNQLVMIFNLKGDAVKGFIKSYGGYAMAVSFALMIFQSVMAPLPAFLITFANAALFGWKVGALLSWTSAMAGAALCFYISRILGRDIASKFAPKSALASVDYFFEKYGKYAIIVCRLLPFISFDIVSYAAGLTSIGFWAFFVATGAGQLPATIVYSYVGGMLTGNSQMFISGLFILFGLSIFGFMLKKILDDRKKRISK